MLGKLLGRRRTEETSKASAKAKPKGSTDEAIIHQTVPDEVFADSYTHRPSPDQSWLDGVSLPDKKDARPAKREADPDTPEVAASPSPTAPPAPVAPAAASPQAEPTVRSAPSQTPRPLSKASANQSAEGRPRFPYGWLVVVEGPGVGEWFPLEKGTSTIGGEDGDTVTLNFDGAAGSAVGRALLAYDDARHAFVVEGTDGTNLRVNGVTQTVQGTLRDGDVIAMGGTALRLVALCSQNFHWAADIEAAGT